jgi:hypothetical protein
VEGVTEKKTKLKPYIVKQMPKIYMHYRKERREYIIVSMPKALMV